VGVDVNAMDADAERVDDDEWDGTEEMRKRKLDEYMDEIYGLDFNDMVSHFKSRLYDDADFAQVGDMPTRFKYTPVRPQSFALTSAEILMATDTELNQYLSVKKYAPYRKDNNWDQTRGDRLKELKQSVAERSKGAYGMGMSGSEPTPDGDGERVKKRKGKKERLKMKAARNDAVEGGGNVRVGAEVGDKLNGKRKHEKMDGAEGAQEGTPSHKRKRRHKKTEQE
jgi:protein KRI1